MSLKIYTAADPTTALSENGVHTNDFLLSMDGKLGGTLQSKLYVRNSDPLYYYTSITLDIAAPTSGIVYLDDSLGYSWKLSLGATQPTEAQWLAISSNNSLTIPDIGTSVISNTTTYSPFWVRVKIPRNASVRTFTDIQFRLVHQKILI